jgi:hypothetical protein
MTSDNITLKTLDDLAALLLASRDAVCLCKIQAKCGTVSTLEAAKIVNQILQSLNQFSK